MKESKCYHQDEILMEESVESDANKRDSNSILPLIEEEYGKIGIEVTSSNKPKVLVFQLILASYQEPIGKDLCEKNYILNENISSNVEFEGEQDVKIEGSVQENKSEKSSDLSQKKNVEFVC